MMLSLSPGRTDSGADYRFYNPFTVRFISEREDTVVNRGMDSCVPSEHPVEWDLAEVDDDCFGSNVDLTRLGATLSGWCDRSDDDEVKGDGQEEPEGNIVVLPLVLKD